MNHCCGIRQAGFQLRHLTLTMFRRFHIILTTYPKYRYTSVLSAGYKSTLSSIARDLLTVFLNPKESPLPINKSSAAI